MDVDNDQFASLGLLFEQCDDLLGILGGKARGWFIHEQDGRFPDQLQGDVEPFSLAAAQNLFQRIAHYQVPGFKQAQIHKQLVNLLPELI